MIHDYNSNSAQGIVTLDQKKHPHFSSLFRTELLPELELFERTRRRRRRLFGLVLLAGAAIFLLIFYRAGYDPRQAVPAAVFALGSCALAVGALDATLFRAARRRDEFSRLVVAKTVDGALPGMVHRPADHVEAGDFAGSGLYGSEFASLAGRDRFAGDCAGFGLSFSWLRADGAGGGDGDDGGVRDLFTGWFFVAEFPRRFRGETLVLPDIAGTGDGRSGRTRPEIDVPPGMRLIQLEDPAFEKAYRVLSSGQLEARYILTPSFMRLAVATGARLGGRLALSFRNNRMYAGVPAWAEYFGFIQARPFTDPAFTRHLFQAVRGVEALAAEIAQNHVVWQAGK